jgi:hypothetical protein
MPVRLEQIDGDAMGGIGAGYHEPSLDESTVQGACMRPG